MGKRQTFAALISLALNFSVYAQDLESVAETASQNPEKKVFSVGVSIQSNDFKYTEPGVMSQSGRMNGFNVFGLYDVNEKVSFLGNVDYSTGKLEYVGALMNGMPIKSEDQYTVMDISAAAQLKTDISTTSPISFLVGLGRRQTVDADDESLFDYRREHIYNYLSVGTAIAIPIGSKDVTSINFGIDTMLFGNVKTSLSDVDRRLPDLDMAFKGGSALKISVVHAHQFYFGQVFGGLNYTKWSLNKSESAEVNIEGDIYGFVEPKNETSILALQAGIIF